jgi:aldehyde oxidoreductase
MLKKTLFINGSGQRVVADPEATLASVLRNQMFLTGTKVGCGKGECGTCTVILDGKAVKSCSVKMKSVPEDAQIITIEGVGTSAGLHPLQLAWMVHGSSHCGFCTPGFILSAKALLDQNINPTRDEAEDWLRKNNSICEDAGYGPLADAVMDAARLIRGNVAKEELWQKLKDGANMPGSGQPDPSAVAKVTGAMDFGADLGLKLPAGTLHIKLVQPQVSHANILSIDAAEAEAMPGVYKVITYKDVPGTNRIYGSGDGKESPILNDKKIMQPGDAIAMVLAFTPALAEEAAKKVRFIIEEQPAPAGAAAKDEARASLEPDTGFAYLDEKGKLVIHSKSTDLQLRPLAEGIGVPVEKLAVVKNPARGASGYKFGPRTEGFLGVAALVVKKPVYLEL